LVTGLAPAVTVAVKVTELASCERHADEDAAVTVGARAAADLLR
jgi:hypothetical protein